MRILWVSTGFPYPPFDGVAVRTYNLIRGLSKQGMELRLLCYRQSQLSRESVEMMRKYCIEIDTVPLPGPPSRVRWLWWKAFGDMPISIRRHFSAEIRRRLRIIHREWAPDVVVCDQIQMFEMCYPCPVPCVLNANDSFAFFLMREADVERNPVRRWSLRWEAARFVRFEMRAYGRVARVVMVSEADAEYARKKLGAKNVVVAGNGVDTEYFDPHRVSPPGGLNGSPLIVFSGSMGHVPNVRAAIYLYRRVLPRVWRVFPRVGLVLAGDDPAAELRQLAAQDSRVTVTGFVEDIRPYIRAADVYACPMLSGSGVKNKVLEAMSMARPIVASPLAVEALPEARAGQHLMLADGEEEFADALVSLLQNETSSRSLGRRARDFVREHYSWEAMGNRFAEILEDVVGGGVSSH